MLGRIPACIENTQPNPACKQPTCQAADVHTNSQQPHTNHPHKPHTNLTPTDTDETDANYFAEASAAYVVPGTPTGPGPGAGASTASQLPPLAEDREGEEEGGPRADSTRPPTPQHQRLPPLQQEASSGRTPRESDTGLLSMFPGLQPSRLPPALTPLPVGGTVGGSGAAAAAAPPGPSPRTNGAAHAHAQAHGHGRPSLQQVPSLVRQGTLSRGFVRVQSVRESNWGGGASSAATTGTHSTLPSGTHAVVAADGQGQQGQQGQGAPYPPPLTWSASRKALEVLVVREEELSRSDKVGWAGLGWGGSMWAQL